MKNLFTLSSRDKSGDLNVIIETPKGSRNKFAFDEKKGVFILKGVLPAGANFPFDFGFIPSTRGEDGDPIDVLLLMDEAAFPGCLVPSRLLGVIEAEQTEKDGKVEKNDRLIAVSADSRTHEGIRTLDDLSTALLDEIEHFFISYNEIKGKKFAPTGRSGPERAEKLISEGNKFFREKNSRKKSPATGAFRRTGQV